MPLCVAVLAVLLCGCSQGSSAPGRAGKASPAKFPTIPATTSTTTTTNPSGVATTVPVPPPTVPGWTQAVTTLPPGGGFSSVSCLSDTFCIATGGGAAERGGNQTDGSGVTVSWDGASWSAPSVYLPAPASGPVTAPLMPAIDCTSGPLCMIVDGSGHVSTGDGTNWSSATPLSAGPPLAANPADPGAGHPGSRSAAVSCPTPTLCAAVDNTGHAYTYRNRSWLATQSLGRPAAAGSPVSSLFQAGRVGVSCPTADTCVAVVGTSVLDWNGSSWSLEPAPWAPALDTTSSATAVACATPTLCAIVSGTGLSYRNGGSAWSPVETIDPHGGLDAISCPTASMCVAADSGGSVTTWDGKTWSAPQQVLPQASEYPGTGTSISCPSADFCMLMNADGDFATYTGD